MRRIDRQPFELLDQVETVAFEVSGELQHALEVTPEPAVGRLAPAYRTRGLSTTELTQSAPRSFFVVTPTASSSYASTSSPSREATQRKLSMWQLEMAATYASSGSTAAALEKGGRTACGEGEAGTTTPPSKCQVCSRE